VGRTGTLLRARIASAAVSASSAGFELWVSVRRVEAARDLAADVLHRHFTNPAIVGCSQAGGTRKADAGRLLLAHSWHSTGSWMGGQKRLWRRHGVERQLAWPVVAAFGNAPQPGDRCLIQMFPNRFLLPSPALQGATASTPPSDRLRGRRRDFP